MIYALCKVKNIKYCKKILFCWKSCEKNEVENVHFVCINNNTQLDRPRNHWSIHFQEKERALSWSSETLWNCLGSLEIRDWKKNEVNNTVETNMKEEARRANEMKCRKNEIIIMFMPCMRRLCTLFLCCYSLVLCYWCYLRKEKKENKKILSCYSAVLLLVKWKTSSFLVLFQLKEDGWRRKIAYEKKTAISRCVDRKAILKNIT